MSVDKSGSNASSTEHKPVGWARAIFRNAHVPEAVRVARLETCRACSHYIAGTRMCGQCNCFVGMKTRLANSGCPLGKWRHCASKDRAEVK